MAVSTDKKKIEHLLKRRVVDCMVEESLRRKLLSGKKLRVKFGADPTKPDLHIGHAVPLGKLKEFQDLGHQVVFIVGDYTALVGDPSGKSKTRPMLSEAEVKENAKTYIEQVGRILDLKKLEIRPNSEWFSKMGFNDVIKLAAQFTVARTFERDDFAKRLKGQTDIHLHELLYPAMQAYDSIMVEADVEIGSSDQRFNILAGRDLQRKLGKPEQDCLFLGPILVGIDGTQKMSKSLGNYIGISEAPEEMLGKAMSIPDTLIWDWFDLTTDLEAEEISKMRSACAKGEMNPRDAKMRLAKEIVSQFHPSGAADRAEDHFNSLFRKKEIPDEIPEIKLPAGDRTIVELLVEAKMAPSKGEARRLVEQGGVKVGGVAVKDIGAKFNPTAEGLLIQKGKRHFVRIVKK